MGGLPIAITEQLPCRLAITCQSAAAHDLLISCCPLVAISCPEPVLRGYGTSQEGVDFLEPHVQHSMLTARSAMSCFAYKSTRKSSLGEGSNGSDFKATWWNFP